MKKVLSVLTLLVVIISILFTNNIAMAYDNGNQTSNSEKEQIELVFFKTSTCISCYKTEKYLNEMKEELLKKGIEVTFKEYDIATPENKEKLAMYDKEYKVAEDKFMLFPAVFYNGKSYIEQEDIKSNLKNDILSSNKKYFKEVTTNSNSTVNKYLKGFTPIGIFIAGLIDGVNPCAIAMLLFFITYLSYLNNKSKVMWVAISYILGTFISYFLLGLGLVKIILSFNYMKPLFIGLYTITIIFSMYLVVVYIKDFFRVKNQEINKVQSQLSQKQKHIIQNILRDKSKAKFLIATSFLTGFIVSLLEFSCTGQMYLPVLTYLISIKTNMIKNVSLLLIYNLAFVVPLICIVVSFCLGNQVVSISNVLVKRLHILKLIGAVFFSIITIIMTIQLINIF